MKKLLFSLILLLVSYVGFSQKGLSYQAVILDPNKIEVPGQDISGQPLVNGDVWMKFSIYNGSTLQFEEVQKTKTDGYGLVNLMIGSVSTASFNSLTWDGVQKSLQVFVSFNQGASYTKVSDQKLNYNPYALYAETAGKLGGVLAISGGGTGATTAADARLNLGLDQVNNTSDAAKPVSTATKAALDLKANTTDVNAGLALKANATDVNAALALKANVTSLNLKENTTNKSTDVTTDGTSDTKYPSVKAVKTYVDAQVTGGVGAATISDADANTKGKIQLTGDLSGTAAAPTVPGLALKANAADLVSLASIVNSNTASITAEVTRATAAKLALENNIASNIVSITANTSDIASLDTNVAANTASITAETTRATAAELTLANNIASNTASISANSTDIATINSNLATNTASTSANATAITAEVSRARAAELVLSNNVIANTASITSNTTSINLKANASDVSNYLSLKADASDVTSALNLKANSSDVTSAMALKASASDLTSGLALKINTSEKGVANGIATLNSSGIIPSTQLPPVTISSTNVVASDADMIALSATVGSIAIRTDLNKNYVLSALPASTLTNWVELLTPAAPVQTVNGYTGAINLSKADINLGNVDNTSDATKPVSTAMQAALDLKLDANKVGVATGVASLNALGKIPTDQIPAISFSSVKVLSSQADMLALSSAVVGSVVIRTDVNKNYVLAAVPATTLGNWIELLTPAPPVQTVNGRSGSVTITQSDIGLSNVQNTSDINKPISTLTQNALNLKANSSDVTAALNLKANLASPTFSGTVTTLNLNSGALSATSVNTPIYASTPQTLTDASTINWNPAAGLNASVTLGGNRALSFTSTPAAGSYGTLVVTQDATGGRTITLPNTTNKVLKSSSTTSIALSSVPGAKDIINFYYDGTYCYWNIGQGYGVAAVSSAVNTGNLTGTVSVANGGTGASTLTGLVKGNGTSAFTAAVAGTDYQEPLTLTTTGTGAATLSGSILNIPTVASTVNASSISGTVAIANGGTGVTTSTGSGSVVLSTSPTLVTPNLGTPASGLATNLTGLPLTTGVTGTLPIANGGTNSTATPTSGGVGYGTGTAHAYTAAGTSGQVLISNGSSAPSWGAVTATSFSGTLSIANGGTGVTSATGSGSVVLSASPDLTGTPTAPTATAGNNTTQIATTAFVTAAVAAGGGGSTYSIGSNPSLGGYVFYVTPDGKHGLVAETYEFDAQLYLGFDYIKDPAYHSTNGKNFTDWRIPSLYELRLMNAIRTTLSMNQAYYWSSSFGSNTWAYKTRRFGDGGEYEQGSDVTHTIRAIRTF